MILLALSRGAVAHGIAKIRRGLIRNGAADVKVLILLRGIVGKVMELPRTGNARRRNAVVDGSPKLRASRGLPAKIARCSAEVILVVGQIVLCLQPAIRAKVVDFVMRPSDLEFLARGHEAPSIPAIDKARESWWSHGEW